MRLLIRLITQPVSPESAAKKMIFLRYTHIPAKLTLPGAAISSIASPKSMGT